ncbi:hypothetical protein [Acinetobacter phage ABPH49]|nr:hypothetical protein [Acinetobacter phage ABPH49]
MGTLVDVGAEDLTLIKITDLPEASTIGADDVFVVDQKGVTKKVKASKISGGSGSGGKLETWTYVATGGEVELSPSLIFKEALLFRGGVLQLEELGAYSVQNNKIVLKPEDALKVGEEVLVAVGLSSSDPSPTYDEVQKMIQDPVEALGNFSTRVTDFGVGFSNWPQGKGVVVGDRAYFGFNLASGHGTIASDAMIVGTRNGIDFGKVRTIAPRTSTEAASAWSLGALLDGTLVSIVRFRKGTNDQAPIRHSIYTSSNNGVQWQEVKAIDFLPDTGRDIVAYHGFVLLGDGKFACGYHDAVGSLGILIVDPTDWSYTTKVLLSAANNNNNGAVLQCELNFLRRVDTGQILVVSRSQNVGISKCKAWVATEGFESISDAAEFPMPFSVNPITPVFTPDFKSVWFFYSNRYDNANPKGVQSGLYVRKCPLDSAFSRDFDTGSEVKRLTSTSAGYQAAAGVGGVQHAVLFGDRILVAYPSKVDDSDSRSDVYCMVIEFNTGNKQAMTQPLASLKGTAAASSAEIRLDGNTLYDPRIRFNGQSVFNMSADNLALGTYGSGIGNRGFALYNYDGTGAQTPALYIRPYDQSYGGESGHVDLNRNVRILKPNSVLHLGKGFRVRIGGDTSTVGQSLIYHNSASNTLEFGTSGESGAPIRVVTYSAQGVGFVRTGPGGASINLELEDSSGNKCIVSGGGSHGGLAFSTPNTSQALRITNNGSLVSKREVAPASVKVAELPTSASVGGMMYATNGRRAGEAVGAGTGVPVFYDGAAWRTFYDNTVVAA